MDSIHRYVAERGGSHPVKRVLVANNGIAAVKVIRSIRRWAYELFGNEREVLFTVMATPEDLRANAEYIRMADSFVEVPGGSNNNNYANVRLIVELAESVLADAVWAGWGHASENPALPTALLKANRPIAFIGPPAGPMFALGDKIGSTIIAQSAGVPTIAWNGADLRVNYKQDGCVPAEVYARANVRTAEEAEAAAAAVGFPLMVKASEGGGGKGIRKVLEPAALAPAFRQVAAEVPGSPIFLMRLAPRSRHLEVQLLADKYGDAIALFGRDCSVQRRHQKIIEEGPVLAASPETWDKMERAAVALAKEVGYENAGTVEYLWMEEDGSFAFLELNPRLQVEHPVTEMISGVNLPSAQLHVAMGIPLWAIPDVRKLYGQDPVVELGAGGRDGASAAAAKIDFDTTPRLPPRGHVIAARVTAENPDSGFQPTSGGITELNFRSTQDVWGYFSVDSSGRVHEFADSQFGHLFAFGKCREDARKHMVMALRELSIRGDIRTTVEYLSHMMEAPDFIANTINTAWLDKRIGEKVTGAKPDPLLTALMGATWRCVAAFARRRADYTGHLERGQYPPPALLSVEETCDLIYDSVKYSLHCTASGPSTLTLACNGSWVQLDVRPLPDGGLLVSLGGRSHLVYAKEESSGLRLVLDGATCQFSNEYDPTTLRAPMSGKLARFLVEDGARVAAGQPYVEVEVMKMYMSLNAPEAGTLQLLKPEGSMLDPGDAIAACALDDPSKVQRAQKYDGELSKNGAGEAPAPAAVAPSRYAKRWHIIARNATRVLAALMAGFEAPSEVFEAALLDRDAAYAAPELVQLEVEEVLSGISSRLPGKLSGALAAVVAAHSDGELEMNVAPLAELVREHAAALPTEKERAAFVALVRPLSDVLEKFRAGCGGASRASLFALLQGYLEVERLFGEGRRPEDVVADLRAHAGAEKAGLDRVFEFVRAHAQLKQRNVLVLAVLNRIGEELELNRAGFGGAPAAPSAASASPGGGASPEKSAPAGGGGWSVGADPLEVGPSRSRPVSQRLRGAHSFVSASSRSIVSDDGAGSDSGSGRGGEGGREGEDKGGSGGSRAGHLDAIDTLDIVAPRRGLGEEGVEEAPAAGAPLTSLRAGQPLLQLLAELRGAEYAEVTLEARQMLVLQQLPSQRRAATLALINQMGAGGDANPNAASVREDAMERLVEDDQPLSDLLLAFLGAPGALTRRNAAEVYVRRLYRNYTITWLAVAEEDAAGGGKAVSVRWGFRANAAAEAGATTPGGSIAGGGGGSVSGVGGGGPRRASDAPSLASGEGVDPIPPLSTPSPAKASYARGRIGSLTSSDSAADFSGLLSAVPLSPPRGAEVCEGAGGARPGSSPLSPNSAHSDGGAERLGLMAAFPTLAAAEAGLSALLLAAFPAVGEPPAPAAAAAAAPLPSAHRAVHVMHVALLRPPTADGGFAEACATAAVARAGAGAAGRRATNPVAEALATDDTLEKGVVERLSALLAPARAALLRAGLRRVTFNIPNPRDTGDSLAASATPLLDAARAFVDAQRAAAAAAASEGGGGAAAAVAAAASARQPQAPRRGLLRGGRSGSSLAGLHHAALPWVYTFRAVLGYAEDTFVRHIEPPASASLELKRLSNFRVRLVPTPNRVVHVYAAEPKDEGGGGPLGPAKKGAATRLRYFVRAIVRQMEHVAMVNNKYDEYPGPERMFVECLDALNLAMRDSLADTTLPVGNNHIFINVLPVVTQTPEYVEQVIKILAKRYADRLRRLRVSQVEFRVVLSAPNGAIVAVRLISSNPTGYVLRVDTYMEARDDRKGGGVPIFSAFAPSTLASQRSWRSFSGGGEGGALAAADGGGGYLVRLGLSSISPSPPPLGGSGSGGGGSGGGGDDRAGDLDGKPVTEPYPLASPFEAQRAGAAAMSDTVYVYDFIELFTRALEIEWSRFEKSRGGVAGGRPRPRRVLLAKELVLRVKGSVEATEGSAGGEDGAGGVGGGGVGSIGGGAAAAKAPAAGWPHPSSSPPLLRRSVSAYGDQFSNEIGGGGGGPLSNGAGKSPMQSGERGGFSAGGAGSGGGGSGGGAGGVGGAPSAANLSTLGGAAPPPAAAARSLDDYELVEASRPPGCNTLDNCGMVAWRVTMFTPQYGEEVGGRDVVLIANDITFRAGSFGTREDRLFELASQYARRAGIPRVYIAANSGARIGLADEVKKLFRAAWADPTEPAKGYRYLYLTPADYDKLCGAGMAALAAEAAGAPPPPAVAALGGGGSGGGGAPLSPAAATPFGLTTVPEGSSFASGSSSGGGSGGAREAHAALRAAPGGGAAPALLVDGEPLLPPPVLVRREVLPSGEVRFVLTDIIGHEPDLGVENLRGSGTIAGETARAYASSFTLTYVTGRSVGIGAYLVRLGQRCIQKATSAPIILTGYEALNKLMGAEVYSSNEQLGGPKIMFTNGVSHELVENDFEGVLSILRWLAFVPKLKGAPLPTMATRDEVDRDVAFEPPATPYDPRLLLTGAYTMAPAAAPASGAPAPPPPTEGAWTPGLFDRDSFRECMAGWAKSVVTGRARLGGIPIGVIVPELRTTTAVSPADPAAPTSQESVTPQAGQVWFPDSAFKTSQAIRDFTGEDLPILILANWRGFSGGARDMFNEVLKFGSTIVDALVAATTPVFVYIPPRGELRGGAWVVVDPTINPAVMEMYCDPSGRGGVLEPSGIVAIKFRGPELAATAARLDPALAALEAAARGAAPGSEAAAAARRAAAARADLVSGVVLQAAHAFADLHDTPGRMLAKGAITGVVPWRRARSFFYWRLRRRLAEGGLARRLLDAAPQMGATHAATLLRGWFLDALAGEGVRVVRTEAGAGALWRDDMAVLRWLADNAEELSARVAALRRESISETVLGLGLEDPTAVVNGVLALLSRLPLDRKEGALGVLRRGLIFGDAGASTGSPVPLPGRGWGQPSGRW